METIVDKDVAHNNYIPGYSEAEVKVIKLLLKQSKNGFNHDPLLAAKNIAEETGLSLEDTEDAVNRLKEQGFLKINRTFGSFSDQRIITDESLFIEFDRYFMGWDAKEDAKRIARDMLNDKESTAQPKEIAEQYGWKPRRLNPAIRHLVNEGVIYNIETLGSHPMTVSKVQRVSDSAIRRFLKKR